MKTMSTKIRERLVTRTITSYVYHCMVVTAENTVGEEMVILGNMTGVSDEKVNLILKDKTEGIFVKVNRVEKSEVLMGMTEDDFIKYAKVIER